VFSFKLREVGSLSKFEELTETVPVLVRYQYGLNEVYCGIIVKYSRYRDYARICKIFKIKPLKKKE